MDSTNPHPGGKNAAKILRALADAGDDGLSQSTVKRQVFSGHISSVDLRILFHRLIHADLVHREIETGKGGRSVMIWRLTDLGRATARSLPPPELDVGSIPLPALPPLPLFPSPAVDSLEVLEEVGGFVLQRAGEDGFLVFADGFVRASRVLCVQRVNECVRVDLIDNESRLFRPQPREEESPPRDEPPASR